MWLFSGDLAFWEAGRWGRGWSVPEDWHHPEQEGEQGSGYQPGGQERWSWSICICSGESRLGLR